MKLYSLIKNINCRVFGNVGVSITGLYHNDVQVKENGLFFCLRGTKVDGIEFVKSAIKNGAVAIVVEQELPLMFGVTQIIVKNTREAMSLIACKFYGNPADKLKLIGVTGTNGKTTIAEVTAKVLKYAGYKVAVVGTNGVIFDNEKYDTGMTTPDPIEFQKYLALMVKKKVEYVCVEVSAHAMDLHKIAGVKFEVGVFTNLTEDHLDYFKTMENYFQSKQKFFSLRYIKHAVVNVDDEYGLRLCEGINFSKITYAITRESDVKAENICVQKGQQMFKIGNINITTNLLGRFNVYNVMAVLGVMKILGVSDDIITKALLCIEPVEGRFNIYEIQGRCFIIDYAHTPDGLKNILTSSKKLLESGKLISVFGCGGNRETQKRSKMGEISTQIADLTIITSDNPRFEKKRDIIKDIVSGIKNDNFIVVEDRRFAIKKAFEISNFGDVIVVSGKGAECYIDEMGIKTYYSDKDEIMKLGGVDE